MAKSTLVMVFEDDPEVKLYTRDDEFMLVNNDSPELVRAVADLPEGESLTWGGGAEPVVTITRISPSPFAGAFSRRGSNLLGAVLSRRGH